LVSTRYLTSRSNWKDPPMTDKFVYVTYIRTSEKKKKKTITKPEFTKLYWFGMTLETTWKKGAPWSMVSGDGREFATGEILEAERAKRIVIKWQHQITPELKAEGYSRCTIEIEAAGDTQKLSVIHEMDSGSGTKFIQAVGGGWPKILSNLKTMLE